MGIQTCTQCDRTWPCGEFRTERRVFDASYPEFRRSDTFVPLLVDMFIDPETACRRTGGPGW